MKTVSVFFVCCKTILLTRRDWILQFQLIIQHEIVVLEIRTHHYIYDFRSCDANIFVHDKYIGFPKYTLIVIRIWSHWFHDAIKPENWDHISIRLNQITCNFLFWCTCHSIIGIFGYYWNSLVGICWVKKYASDRLRKPKVTLVKPDCCSYNMSEPKQNSRNTRFITS